MVEERGIDPAAKPVRRTYTAEYKARVLAEYEAAAHGEKSAVLRREGLYQTLVAEWAKARDAALRAARIAGSVSRARRARARPVRR